MAEGFKKMTKMYTDEPSVVLNLKKGGKVASKMAKGGKPMKKAMGGESLMSALAGTPALVGRPAMNMPVAVPKKPSMASRRKAMMAPPPMKKGGMAKHDDAAQDRAMIKKAMSGKKFANGGGVTSMMTKTTVSSAMAKPYDETMMHTTPKGKTSGATGDVKQSNGGGYKAGGSVASRIVSDTNESPDKGTTVNGGTIKGNAKNYLETQMHTAKTNKSSGGTGDVKMGNGAGFKRGGKIKMNTGGVANTNAGGYKMGGKTSKKAYATGEEVKSGAPVAMPQGKKKPSPPVRINQLSGTF